MSPSPGTLEYFGQQQVLAGNAPVDFARPIITTLRFDILPHLLHGRVIPQARFVRPCSLYLAGHQKRDQNARYVPAYVAAENVRHWGHRLT